MFAKRSFVFSVRSVQPRYMATKPEESKVILTKEVKNNGLMLLNRPKSLNSANVEFNVAFSNILNEWKDTKSLIVVRGNSNGGKAAFCAGGDLVSVVQNNSSYTFKWSKTIYTALYRMHNLRIPYVALCDGVAMGTGLGIGVGNIENRKYCVATERTICAMPELHVGLFPDVASASFLNKLTGNLGYYIALTGAKLKGPDVLHAGLATHYCDSSNIHELENTLLNLENSNDVEGVLNEFCPRPQSEFSLTKQMDQINKCFDANSVEEIMANLQTDGSDWAKQTSKILRRVSPTSLKVAFRHLKWGADKSIGEVLQMDYRLICNFYFVHDFYEGVRALLVEKDNKPQWKPSRLEDLSAEKVETYFEPAANNDELDIDVHLPDAEQSTENLRQALRV